MGMRTAYNVYPPALDIIREKGYSVSAILLRDDDSLIMWETEKDDFSMSAINPVELLGQINRSRSGNICVMPSSLPGFLSAPESNEINSVSSSTGGSGGSLCGTKALYPMLLFINMPALSLFTLCPSVS